MNSDIDGTEVWTIGLMSGTSVDGIDAVLARFPDSSNSGATAEIVSTCSQAYTPQLRKRILALSIRTQACMLQELALLDAELGDAFADTALQLIEQGKISPKQIAAIGSHGQTVFHDPAQAHNSLQLGDANRIAARTGIITVADFRRRDMAEGGQGAPLVPAFHHAMFARDNEALAVVNIGGIANITLLPDADANHVRGYDTGPGNGLMDEWAARHLSRPFDDNGNWAATGRIHQPLLDALLAEPWLAQAPPKSTGRDQFNINWVARRFPALDEIAPPDVQASLCELTAKTIAGAAAGAARLLICGGGARNGFLMERLGVAFTGPVETTEARGLPPQWVEATAFAWLALRRLARLPGNLPAVTGARLAAVLGAVYPGR